VGEDHARSQAVFCSNEEPVRKMTQKTALRSIIPKDVMTSLLSLLTLNRRKIGAQFSTGLLAKENVVHMSIMWNFHEKTDEISIALHLCIRSFQILPE
jgi:hypothetical protein